MPAGMVRPRASQVPPLSPAGRLGYSTAGWHITEHGGVDLGQRVGPCATCREPTVRYGPTGHPQCPTCRPQRTQ